MNIGMLCSREVDLAGLEETATVAAKRMLARNVGSLVVAGADRRPIGIVTDRDLVLRVLAAELHGDQVLVRDVISGAPRTVPEDASIEDALATMRACRLRRLLVVDDRGCLAGIVALDDILGHLGKETELVRQILEAEGPRAGM